MPDARTDVATRLPEQDAQLARSALAVLDANWLGHATKPSPYLYPHQWSWDSACIAMGYARWNQDRAETELRSLFAGQWRNGLLPHIVFAKGDGRYFPGPDFWQARRSPDAPAGLETSGIVQPPIHATAAWRVYQRSGDRAQARAFLEELAPKLAAWHAYLYRERTRGSDGLVEIWHPWESGMDNSPALGRGADADPPVSGRDPRVPAGRRPAGGPCGAPDRRRVRPVRLPRRALPRPRLPSRQDPGGDAVRAPVRALQLPPRPVEPGSGGDRAPARRRPRALRELGGADGRRRRREALGRGGSRLRRLRRVGGAPRRRADSRGPGAAPCRDPDRRAGAPDDRRVGGVARRGGRRAGVGGDEPRAGRSGLHADAVLAGPDLAHPQLGASERPRPVRVPRPRRRRSGAR